MSNKKANRRILFLAAIIMCSAAVVSVIVGCRNAVKYPSGSFDFQYDSAKVFSKRIDPYEETMNPTGLQESLDLKKYYSSLQANQFPSMIMMLLPFTLMSPMVANWVWMLCNVLFSVGIVYLIKILIFDECFDKWCQDNTLFVKKDGALLYCFFVSLLFVGTPWRNNIGNGQHTIMALFCFLLAVYFSKRNKEVLSGTALAVSFFKYTLTVPLAIYFLYKKKYKTLLVSISIHIVLTVIAAIWLNVSVVDLVIKPIRISSRFTSEGFLDIGAVFKLGNVGMIITMVILIAMLVYVVSGKYKGTDSELISLLVLVSLIATYHRPYDYFVLIIPVVVIMLKKNNPFIKAMICSVTLYTFVVRKVLSSIRVSNCVMQNGEYCFAIILYIGVIFAMIGFSNSNDVDLIE